MNDVGEAFRDFSGLFYIRKIPFPLNSLCGRVPEQLVYTFRMKRKKLWIEKMHLPPEISRTTGKIGEENEKVVQKRKGSEGLLCQPGPKDQNPLDF
jgi:elongator complex protein 4